jgi:hypothetical protein
MFVVHLLIKLKYDFTEEFVIPPKIHTKMSRIRNTAGCLIYHVLSPSWGEIHSWQKKHWLKCWDWACMGTRNKTWPMEWECNCAFVRVYTAITGESTQTNHPPKKVSTKATSHVSPLILFDNYSYMQQSQWCNALFGAEQLENPIERVGGGLAGVTVHRNIHFFFRRRNIYYYVWTFLCY